MKFAPAFSAKGAKFFPNMLWGELTAQGAYPAEATLFSTSAKPCASGVTS